MESIEIFELSPLQWQDYKNIRLRALKEEPQAYQTTYEEAFNEPEKAWGERLVASKLGENQWYAFARLDGKLIGMAGAFSKGNEIATIVSVFVAREARGKWISKKLLTYLISKIQKNDRITRLKLEVNPTQVPALKLYQRLGFKKTGSQKLILGDGKEYEDYIMELPLHK